MNELDTEQIAILIDLFKWMLGGFVGFLILVGRWVYMVHKDISEMRTNHAVHTTDFENLKESHRELQDFVFNRRKVN